MSRTFPVSVGQKMFLHFLDSPRMRSGPRAWIVISSFTALFLAPYALPGTNFLSLGSYGMVILLPLAIAAYLRPRGSFMLVSVFSAFSIAIKISFDIGLGHPWPVSIIGSFFLGWGLGLVFGLAVSKFRLLSLQLAEAHRHIQRQAFTDALTNLPNHRSIMDALEEQLTQAHQSQQPFSLLFFDADHFKQINDTYGHASGDIVLCELALRASQITRTTDSVGRLGGEEFLMLLPDTKAQDAQLIAERLRTSVSAHPILAGETSIAVTLSIGVATYPTDAQTCSDLLSQADQAMYTAKHQGRDRVCSSSPNSL